MSPRPIVDEEALKYAEKFEFYKQVKPGITGLWQVSGRNDLTYQERVQRSSRSVCANIVEGFAKRKYENIFKSSLNAALGESEETKLWLDFAVDCGYLLDEKQAVLCRVYEQVGAMAWTLMKRWESFK